MSTRYATPLCIFLLTPALSVAQRFQTVYEPHRAAPTAAATTAAARPNAPAKPSPPPAYFRADVTPDAPTRLHWRTPIEQPGWSYRLERSADQEQWEPLGQVPRADSTGVRMYAFTDEAPLPVAHYRLTYLDRQGQPLQTRLLSVLTIRPASRGVAYCWYDTKLVYVGLNKATVRFPVSLILYDPVGQLLCDDVCATPATEYPIDVSLVKTPPNTPITLQIVDADHRVLLIRRIDLARR